MVNKINDISWQSSLEKEFDKPYFTNLLAKIEADKKNGKIILPFPSDSLVYRAFELTPLWKVKVVMLGQDPYPDLKKAMGLAFSVPATRDAPRSLNNIFKELKSDLGIENKFNDLSYWAAQGVLLLNTVLTVNRGTSSSHKGYGWETFTDEALKCVCKYSQHVVYLLLGNEAQKKEELIINNSKPGTFDLIKLPHPSPLSAHKGFFWSKPFSRINKLLVKNKLEPIDWRL